MTTTESKKMTQMTVRLGDVLVRFDAIYADGSGAPAQVLSPRGVYAANYTAGQVGLHLTSRRVSGRRDADLARGAYLAALRQVVAPEWFALHAALYASPAQ